MFWKYTWEGNMGRSTPGVTLVKVVDNFILDLPELQT